MALASGTLFEIRASATTGNTGGAGFNPANANFPTDGAATVATGNSPVLTSATYNFVAGDVGAWIYVKAGTNWTPGFYQIASVAANAATLSAAIGQAVQLNATTGMYIANTVAGCATTASPTGGTFGVDYSQLDAAKLTLTDLASVGGSTTVTSVTGGWTPVSVGNFLHVTTTGTGAHFLTGWYEIVTYTSATQITTDRTTNDATAGVAGTGQTGGAGRLNGLEDAFFEMIPIASTVYVKNGTYTASGAVSVASTNSTAASPSNMLGYNALRGDACTGANRPVIAHAANAFASGQSQNFINFIFTNSNAGGVTPGVNSTFANCKFHNSSSTTTRVAMTITSSGVYVYNCEFISQNGTAITQSAICRIYGNYFHDSSLGFVNITAAVPVIQCLFEACFTAGYQTTLTSNTQVTNCTFYGREAKMGIGVDINVNGGTDVHVEDCIFYGLTNGLNVLTTEEKSNTGHNNNFFNNTTDVTNYTRDPTDLALDPTFAGATQITGTTASGSGSVLTDTNANFGTVTDNVDFVRVTSGTGATLANFLVTAHTTTTLTCNNTVGTNATADRVYYVTTGHNFAIGTNLKAAGFPGAYNGSETTSYLDIGAAQRQETASSGGASSHTFS